MGFRIQRKNIIVPEIIEKLEERRYIGSNEAYVIIRLLIIPKSQANNPKALAKLVKLRRKDKGYLSCARIIIKNGTINYLFTRKGMKELLKIINEQINTNKFPIDVGTLSLNHNDKKVVLVMIYTEEMIRNNQDIVTSIVEDFEADPPNKRPDTDKGFRHLTLKIPDKSVEESINYEDELNLAEAENRGFNPNQADFPKLVGLSKLGINTYRIILDQNKITGYINGVKVNSYEQDEEQDNVLVPGQNQSIAQVSPTGRERN